MAFTYCENCGEKIDDSAKFCPNCGYVKNDAHNGSSSSQGGVYGEDKNSNEQSSYGSADGYGQNPYGNNPNPYGRNPYGNGQSPYGNYPPFGNRPQNGGEKRSVNTGIVIFALLVTFFSSCVTCIFGILALITALNAPNEPTAELMEKKNKTAIMLCVIGIISTVVIGALFLIMMVFGGSGAA